MNALVDAILAGDRLSLARAITKVENQQPDSFSILDQLFLHTGKAHLVGVTGAPGSGKSSLVNQITRIVRHPSNGEQPKSVAIVAVDPTSPFTGGALLGDRVRMRDLAGDPGVFIRSMASRGALGGLATRTSQVVQVLDAAGYEMIIIETVGVGQSEIDIASLAHTVLVVEAPGMGDDIQAGKAGILEIADLLVVNKADQEGAEHTVRVLNHMLDMAQSNRLNGNGKHLRDGMDTSGIQKDDFTGWHPPVLKTIAIQGDGIVELLAQISRHWNFLQTSGQRKSRENQRLMREMEQLLQEELWIRWRGQVAEDCYQKILYEISEKVISPHQAVQQLII